MASQVQPLHNEFQGCWDFVDNCILHHTIYFSRLSVINTASAQLESRARKTILYCKHSDKMGGLVTKTAHIYKWDML